MSGAATRFGVTPSRLRFGEEPKQEGTWAGRRLLLLDDEPAFELSFWCGTCAFLFRRLDGANQTVAVEQLQARLTEGIGLEPDIIATFAKLLPEDESLPLLLSVTPRLSLPMRAGDYFA